MGWAEVKRHVASEITLLCDSHHRAKTAGFLPNDRVIKANENPRNLESGSTKPYGLYYSGDNYLVRLGSIAFQGSSIGNRVAAQAVRIDGEALLWVILEDGHFLLNLRVYNNHDEVILNIDDNELVLNVHSWDIEIVGSRLTIRETLGDILFDIAFSPPSTVSVMRGRFLRNGIELLITSQWVAILNNMTLFQNVTANNCSAGFVIGDDAHPPACAFRIEGMPRRDWDRAAAIKRAREMAQSPSSSKALNDIVSSTAFD